MRAAGRFYRPYQRQKGMIESKSIYIAAFRDYKNMGLDPLPIPYENGHPTKGPKIAGWQTKAANHQVQTTGLPDRRCTKRTAPVFKIDIPPKPEPVFMIGHSSATEHARHQGRSRARKFAFGVCGRLKGRDV